MIYHIHVTLTLIGHDSRQPLSVFCFIMGGCEEKEIYCHFRKHFILFILHVIILMEFNGMS